MVSARAPKWVGSQQGRVKRGLLLLLAIVVVLLFVWPIVWTLTSAFRPNGKMFSYLQPLRVFALIPNSFTLGNVSTAIRTFGFGTAVKNSLIVALTSTALGLAVCVPAAFALAVFRFPFRRLTFVVLFVSFSVPFDVIAIPLFQVFKSWGLVNTYPGLILPGIANGFAVFLVRQFFLNIPSEMEESARVEGASWLRILMRIYVPLAMPAVVTAALMIFIAQWQSFLWPLIMTTTPRMQLGAVDIANMSPSGLGLQPQYGALFAGATVMMLIPGVLLLLFQRYFIQSIASKGLGGR